MVGNDYRKGRNNYREDVFEFQDHNFDLLTSVDDGISFLNHLNGGKLVEFFYSKGNLWTELDTFIILLAALHNFMFFVQLSMKFPAKFPNFILCSV